MIDGRGSGGSSYADLSAPQRRPAATRSADPAAPTAVPTVGARVHTAVGTAHRSTARAARKWRRGYAARRWSGTRSRTEASDPMSAPTSPAWTPPALSPPAPARPAPAPAGAAPRPLLVTADPDLLDDLLRLAASAGLEVEVAAHPGAARPSWSTAPIVLVGYDLAEAVATLQLPRRPAVIVVGLGDPGSDPGLWRCAVDLGAESVLVLPQGQEHLLERLAGVDSVDEHGTVIAVVGGRGGAGASLFAVAMCLAAVRAGRTPLLVDADPWGGGADLLLGAEQTPGLRWPDLSGLSGQVSGQGLAAALPCPLGVGVVSWDRGSPVDLPTSALVCVLDAAARSYPLVVVDLARRADPLSSAVLSRAVVTYLVVPAEVRAAAAAARTLAWLLPGSGSQLVVRTRRRVGLAPEAVAAMLGVPLAAVITHDPRLAAAVDAGSNAGLRARSSLGRVADQLVIAHLGSPAAAVA